MTLAETLTYLASCAVNGAVPEAERISGINIEAVLSLSSYHLMSAVTAMALDSAGLRNDLVKNAISFSLRKNIFLEAANSSVIRGLEEAGIWYMPLKGAVLKNYYPRFGMREMSDYDILFDAMRAGDVKRIMKNTGFTGKNFGTGNHDVYYKKPLCNFEMHRRLFGISHDKRFYTYYIDVKDRLIKDKGNNYGYHFIPEDFYVYMTVHEYKHYSAGGTGLRSLLDVYVFLKKFEGTLDFNYISGEVNKLGISEFELKNRTLALNLFGNNELTDENREMLEYILHSGAYGTLENSVKNTLNEYGGGTQGKVKYLLTKIFPSVKSMKDTYPFFCEHKVLYPLLIIYRLLKALTLKRQHVLSVLKILWRTK